MKAITNKRLFFTSIMLAAYFSFLYLNAYVFKSRNVLIGVVQEMITLPILVVLVFFLGLAIQRFIDERFGGTMYLSAALIVLLITTGFIICSFVMSIFLTGQ